MVRSVLSNNPKFQRKDRVASLGLGVKWVFFLKAVPQFSDLEQHTFIFNFLAEGNGNPLQYSHLENPMDRGAWRDTVHGVTKNQTQLSNQHFLAALCSMRDLSSLTRDRTRGPLNHQGSITAHIYYLLEARSLAHIKIQMLAGLCSFPKDGGRNSFPWLPVF